MSATVGSSLTGEVYDLADLSTPLATVSANDSTYQIGEAGLFVTDYDTRGGLAAQTRTVGSKSFRCSWRAKRSVIPAM